MAKTFVEKIFEKRIGKAVEPGQIVEADVDYVMANDVTAPPAFEAFEKLGAEPLRDKIILIPDHYVPNKDVASAIQAKSMRDFAKKWGLPNYYEVGSGGVCHQLMMELGYVAPGRIIVGADSHTCTYGALGAFSTGIGSTEAATVFARGKLWFKIPKTDRFSFSGKVRKNVFGKDLILKIIGDIGVDGALYKSMEVGGKAVEALGLSDRMTIANMAIEAGAKNLYIRADQKVERYLKGRVKGKYRPVVPDKGASYDRTHEYDASDIPPLVAMPFLPSNVKPAAEVGVRIDQAYLGSCTNGRIEDLRAAAKILKGKKVAKGVRMIVVPSSKSVFEQAMKEDLIKIFMDADAYVSGPTCGACLGGYMGVLAPGEVAVSSTNRNFVG
ncbi:MAG TPA: 3-isopropylmalate dehydratase large subunit, partial [Thermoplasmata archaeon]|nr:3-isopropylmalate dehydratase large subunit [Thermoplasmata archaeon]